MGQRETVLITGASSGIGRELARLFASRDYRVVLVARRRDRLEEVASELARNSSAEAWVEICDLANRDSLEKWIEDLSSRLDRVGACVDVLVNNAGFGISGAFSEISAESERELIDLNIHAVTRLTRAFLPGMISRGRGRILQVASTAGFQPGPGMAVYFASKAYVLSLGEALSIELRGTGVSVTVLCPGPTKTGFEERLGGQSSLFHSWLPVSDAAFVARVGFQSLMAGKRVAIPGIRNRILLLVGHLTPRALILRLMAGVTRRRQSFRTKHSKNVPTP